MQEKCVGVNQKLFQMPVGVQEHHLHDLFWGDAIEKVSTISCIYSNDDDWKRLPGRRNGWGVQSTDRLAKL